MIFSFSGLWSGQAVLRASLKAVMKSITLQSRRISGMFAVIFGAGFLMKGEGNTGKRKRLQEPERRPCRR